MPYKIIYCTVEGAELGHNEAELKKHKDQGYNLVSVTLVHGCFYYHLWRT